MIRVKDGAVLIESDGAADIMSDLTCAIKAVKDTLESEFDEETVRGIIAFCGKLADKSGEELEKDNDELMEEIMGLLDGKQLN
jgi:hypothetical protein